MKPTNTVKPSRFIDRVSVYGLEFAVAMVTLVISVSVLSFATFALCNYFAYDTVGTGRGYFALWSSASTIVWVPVALLFYLRARSYIAQHPDVTSNAVQRVFTVIYQVIMILTIISFAVSAVYAVLMSLVKPDDTSDILLAVALPATISALLFGGALVSFFRTPVVRRRTFAIVFSVVALAIVIPTVAVSVISLRGINADQYKEADLYSVKLAIDDYTTENKKLPSSLSDVKSFVKEDATKERLDEYTFKKAGETRYQLCADFGAESNYLAKRDALDTDVHRSYANFDQHKQGENCYKLRVTTSSIDYRVNYPKQ